MRTIRPQAFSACAESLETRRLLAVAPFFTSGTQGASPYAGAAVGSTVYYNANDGVHGNELWKSDGTAAGTVMVQDIALGSAGSAPGQMTNFNGTVYFAAETSSHYQLWMSNGTAAGTVMVKDVALSSGWSATNSFLNVNGKLLFVVGGSQLWASDGTTAGTALVKDFSSTGSIQYAMVSGGKGVFTVGGTQLWRSDGTVAGTTQISTPGSTFCFRPTDVNGTTYFLATGGLWKANPVTGAAAFLTYSLADTNFVYLASANGKLFFTYGGRLYRTDSAGTYALQQYFSSSPGNLTPAGTRLYFTASDGTHGLELWRSDGSDAGTAMVRDINPTAGASSYPSYLTNVNGTIYCYATGDAATGYELWKSDGTSAGTLLVKDIAPGGASSYISMGVAANGMFFCSATDGVHGWELWRSDGTAAGTFMPVDANTTLDGTAPTYPVSFNNRLLFAAAPPSGISRLWQTDGTTAGTAPINAAGATVPTAPSNPTELTLFNGAVYFAADDGVNGKELWRTDGTPAGTYMVKDVCPGSRGSTPSSLVNANGTLYFVAGDGLHGGELWKSDGTNAGTTMVADINPGTASATISNLTFANGLLFFRATDGVHGVELWETDGTAARTRMLQDVNPGAASSNPFFLTDVNGTLLFFASTVIPDPANPTGPPLFSGTQLWRSDGTASGTQVVKNVAADSSVRRPARINGRIFFTASDGSSGKELWVSDGTPTGTTMLKDINAGAADATPTLFTTVGATLYFVAADATAGQELWRTDGTLAGTTRVKDIRPGTASASISNLVNANGTLYFTADDGVNGPSLWQTNGTAAGTTLVSPPVNRAQPVAVGVSNGVLYGTVGGFSLWRLTPPSDVAPPRVLGRYLAFQAAAPALVLNFSEDVSATLSPADIVVTNVTTHAVLPASSIAVTYEPNANTATVSFTGLPNGRLPDADYTLTVVAAGVTDASGNRLDGDANGSAGGDFTYSYFSLAADANRDRAVNFADLVVLAQNYNSAGRVLGEGDFNDDGKVDFFDLVMLAQTYNTSLPQAASTSSSAVAAASVDPVLAPVGANEPSVFSTLPIVRPLSPSPVRPPQPVKPHQPRRAGVV